MDPAKNGQVSQFQSPNDSYRQSSAIRGAMIQKYETLKHIKREIAQLVEKEKQVEENLAHLSIELAPHNSYAFPNEILNRIFILVAQDHGPVHFPIDEMEVPPQFAISHVCSHWRRVALRTPELWSNTRLAYPEIRILDALDKPMYLCYWQRWLLRAGTFPVTLWIDFHGSALDSRELASELQDNLLPFQVERLRLTLTYMQLPTLAETTLSDLRELEVDLTFPAGTWLNLNLNLPHHLITRLRSIAFHSKSELDAWLDKFSPSLPWSQLRSLSFDDMCVRDPSILINILQQIPTLQTLDLSLRRSHIDALTELTMPALQDFSLDVGSDVVDGRMLDKILRNFTFRSLSKLKLSTYSSWTTESLDILKGQYNMQGLQEIDFVRGCPQPISLILQNAPVLRTLSVKRNALLDDEAIIGISSGALGRFLRKLTIKATGGIDEVIVMVEARMKTVNQLIENGCTWTEDIAILKDITICARRGDKGRESEKVIALMEAGINITFYP